MRDLPRRIMIRLAAAIMIAADAALGAPLRGEGLRPFTPPSWSEGLAYFRPAVSRWGTPSPRPPGLRQLQTSLER